VYQINVVMPADLAPRTYALRLAVKGTFSNSSMIPMQGR
jgi:uncharacterized protein (TIGR03437 family)